jgi:hypothetical protein
MAGSDSSITYDKAMLTKTADLIDAAIMANTEGITISPMQSAATPGSYGEFNFKTDYDGNFAYDGSAVGELIDPKADGVMDSSVTPKGEIDPNGMTQDFSSHYNDLLFSLYMVSIKMEGQLGQTEDNLRKMASVYEQTEDANKRSVFDITLPLSSRG